MSVILFFTGLFCVPCLASTKWELAAWSVSSRNPADYQMTLNFDKKTLSGCSAVNSYGGGYKTGRNGKLDIRVMWVTIMAGSPDAMEAETIYFDLLGKVKKYTKTADELKLLDENGNELLTFQIHKGITNTKWKLTGWSVSSIDPLSYSITLDFDTEDFSGRAAVNSYFGGYEAGKDGSLKISGIGCTDMAGPPDAMQAESTYFELLGNVKKYTKTSAVLTLLDENSNELLIFEKVS